MQFISIWFAISDRQVTKLPRRSNSGRFWRIADNGPSKPGVAGSSPAGRVTRFAGHRVGLSSGSAATRLRSSRAVPSPAGRASASGSHRSRFAHAPRVHPKDRKRRRSTDPGSRHSSPQTSDASLPTAADRPVPSRASQISEQSLLDPVCARRARPGQTPRRTCPCRR